MSGPLSGAPLARALRVNALRRAVADGTYRVASEEIADKLMAALLR